VLRLGLGMVSWATFAYSIVVLLMAFQGFFPRACNFNAVCGQLRMPTEMLGVLILVGVNCAIAGNLWWAIGWAAGEVAKNGESTPQMEFLRLAATRVRWVFWTATGAMLALPLLFVAVWLAVHIIGLLVAIPILVGKLLG
jgi:hypothetical protein